MEKKIGELRYSTKEVSRLVTNTKKDLTKQHEDIINELNNNIYKQITNDIKEIEKRLKAVKEIDKNFTDDLTKNLTKLGQDLGGFNKITDEMTEKLGKSEINFGKAENVENNI